ncbi:MAG TPA: hypothetical protein DEB06_01395 [Phycisphaerales bacterium]|nr:hypothetical protein [Phycisphaerales bacterium]
MRGGGRRWTPAIGVLVHLAARASSLTGWVVWVGRRVWASPAALARAGLLGRSLFVDAPDAPSRLWAADASLRAAGLVVVADAGAFTLPASRRLQLAAESGGSIGLLARPARDAGSLSAAVTRWRVSACPGGERPRWEIQLLRCKGSRALGAGTGRCVVERSRDGVRVVVPERVVEHPRPAASAS